MKIDILMAVYNGEKYIRGQIDSILNQSYTDFRLLISDDVSTDATRKILDEYVKKDSRVVVFLQTKNIGPAKNFEYLMKKVESEYFMFSDQDDIWEKNKIQKSMDKMIETNSDLVYTNLEIVDQDLNLVKTSYWKEKGFEKKVKKYNNFASLYLNNFVTGSTMLVKSKWISKILPFPQKSKYILHDYWTALMVSRFGKMSYIEQPQVKYRQHFDNQIGSKRRSDEIEKFSEMRNLFLDVKCDHFKTFIKESERFESEEIESLNKMAFQYFEDLRKGKKVRFENKKLFWKLYHYENFSYAFQNYIILNRPKLAEKLFQIKKGLSKK